MNAIDRPYITKFVNDCSEQLSDLSDDLSYSKIDRVVARHMTALADWMSGRHVSAPRITREQAQEIYSAATATMRNERCPAVAEYNAVSELTDQINALLCPLPQKNDGERIKARLRHALEAGGSEMHDVGAWQRLAREIIEEQANV